MKELPPIEVPMAALSQDALLSVLESFILREGTDYGAVETLLETKVANLRRKLQNGSARLLFDPNSESITFVTDAEWKKIKSAFDL
jgi:uncharacterized protein